jgi:hypothetical protein
MKKILSAVIITSVTSLFANPTPPPMPPSFGSTAHKPFPNSCKTLPRMIVFLPPPMEADFIKCKNDLNMPMMSALSKSLTAKFGKVSDVKMELAQGFSQLYKVTFKKNNIEKTIFTNGALTKFIDGSVFNFGGKIDD